LERSAEEISAVALAGTAFDNLNWSGSTKGGAPKMATTRRGANQTTTDGRVAVRLNSKNVGTAW